MTLSARLAKATHITSLYTRHIFTATQAHEALLELSFYDIDISALSAVYEGVRYDISPDSLRARVRPH